MKRVEAAEIESLEDYQLGRAARRKEILEIKGRRRVAVGDHLTLLFENHETVLYQIQEMLRVERITELRAIAHEITTYNELVGGTDEVCSTLLIEYADETERDARLRDLVGLQEHVRLEVDGVGACRAEFDLRQMSTERISAVHYVRFRLGGELATAIREGAAPEVVIDHPEMAARAVLTADQAAALADDLR